ncbi:MAG: hypothetical protein Q4D38_10925 [Planctomycetia bacterium]|nr:hypothetical protein [Planctomycetia bacterium]
MKSASKDVQGFGAQARAAASAMSGAFKSVPPQLVAMGSQCELVNLGMQAIGGGVESVFESLKTLFLLLKAHPMVAAFGAAAAAAAGLYYYTERLKKAEQERLDLAIRTAEEQTKRQKEKAGAYAADLRFLEVLSKKEKLSAEERSRAREVARRVDGVEVAPDGKILGVGKALERHGRDASLSEIASIDAELRAHLAKLAPLQQRLADMDDPGKQGRGILFSGSRSRERKEILKQIEEVEDKVREVEKRKVEVQTALQEIDIEKEEAQREAEAEAAKRAAEAEAAWEEMRAKSAQAQESRHQRALRELNEEFKVRTKLLKIIVEELEKKKKLTEEEKKRLKVARAALAEHNFDEERSVYLIGGEYDTRYQAIKAQEDAEIEKFRTAPGRQKDAIKQEEQERKKKNDFARLQSIDPMAAAQMARDEADDAQKKRDDAQKRYDASFAKFSSDGRLSEEEKAQLEGQLKTLEELDSIVREWKEAAETENVQALAQQPRSAGPGETVPVLMKNSVAAMQKILEIKTEQWSPVLESNRLLNQILDVQKDFAGSLEGI